MRGLQLRLHRLQHDGYYSLLAADHGMSQGLVSGIETMREVESLFSRGAVAGMRGVVLNFGLARFLRPDIESEVTRQMVLVVQIYGRPARSRFGGVRQPLCSIEDAIAVGAESVSFQIDVSQSGPETNFRELAELASRSRSLGIPSLLMVSGIATDSAREFLSIVRSLTELPVDLLKVAPGSLLHELQPGCLSEFPIPCLYAGGESNPTFNENLRIAKRAGFSGVCIGRNFFQPAVPVPEPVTASGGDLAPVLARTAPV
jgi:fructose-bisphosphate aldolase/2-amino-3,7-dideoxy-D-threo-hept-6-ulosonate synthase